MSKAESSKQLPQGPINTRLAPRYAMHIPVDLLFDDGVRLGAITRDISATGVFIFVNRSPRVDESLRFLVTFPKEITTSCRLRTLCDGVVVRREAIDDLEGLAVKIRKYEFLSSPD